MVRNLLLISLFACLAHGLQAQQKSDAPAKSDAAGKSDATGFNLFGDSSAKGPTIITATDAATFDSANHVAVFVGNVQVQDPQFSMTCDKLTVQLDKEGGGMKQADADGHVFIVSVKKNKDGTDEKSTGKGEKSIYTPGDGRIALFGWPQVEQNGNTHIATEATTKMYLFKDGGLKTNGGSRTIIQPATAKPGASPTPHASGLK